MYNETITRTIAYQIASGDAKCLSLRIYREELVGIHNIFAMNLTKKYFTVSASNFIPFIPYM